MLFRSSKLVPKILKSRKDTIGLRIPDNTIARSLVKELGRPILSSSLPGDFAGGQGSKEKPGQDRRPESDGRVMAVPLVEEYTDPEMIQEKFGALVDIVVDGGIGGVLPSTVIDCTGDEPVLIRKGLGTWEPQID